MKFGLMANPNIRGVKELGERVLKVLGPETTIENHIAEVLGVDGKPIGDMDVDILVTVGGDGTILRALQKTKAAIAGVNAGVVGFLTSIDTKNLEERLDLLKNGQFTIEERMKLKVCKNDERLLDCTNEGVLHTSHVSKMRHFEIFVDDDRALSIRADGIIVSTPTGSTCYSMSVGGPIIAPGVHAFVISMIAPFKLYVRPIVVPASSQIKIKLVRDRDCVLVLDGQEEIDVGPDEVVAFSKSEEKSKFVRFEEEFYNRVWENLTL